MPSTIGEVLAHRAATDPHAPAIVCSTDTFSFADLDGHVKGIGAQLREAGVGSASRVGIALQRGPEAALLNVAICSNATVLPINPNLQPRISGGTEASSSRCPGLAG